MLPQSFPRKIKQSIIICTTPRSRSTLFSDALRLTGQMGEPAEWFNDYLFKQILEKYGLQWHVHPLLLIQAITDHATTGEGIFSVKAIDEYFFRFLDRLRHECRIPNGVSEWPWLQPYLPNAKFILWTRKTKLAQAISFDKAQQGGAWHSTTSASARASSDLLYDGNYIQWMLQDIMQGEDRWRTFLESSALPFLELEDTALLEDYAGTLKRVGAFLEIDSDQLDFAFKDNPLKRVGDRINEFWEELYMDESAEGLPADFHESSRHWSNLTHKLWIEVEKTHFSIDPREPVFLRVQLCNQLHETLQIRNSKGFASIAAIRAQWVDQLNPKRRFPAFDALVPVELGPRERVSIEIPIASPALAEKHALYLILMVRDESWVRLNGINSPQITFDFSG